MRSHEQEKAINSPPQSHLIHLFLHAPENHEQRFAAVTRGFGLARQVTKGTLQEVQQLEEDLEEICLHIQTHRERLSAMRLSLETQNTVVTAAEEAMLAEETPTAATLYDETSDQEDVDHM